MVGVALDGHLIVGPYDKWGGPYECFQFDSCGGTYLDDGSYVYPLS